MDLCGRQHWQLDDCVVKVAEWMCASFELKSAVALSCSGRDCAEQTDPLVALQGNRGGDTVWADGEVWDFPCWSEGTF